MAKHLVDLDDDLLAAARAEAALDTLARLPPLTDEARRAMSGLPADPLTEDEIDAALSRLRNLTADERQALWH